MNILRNKKTKKYKKNKLRKTSKKNKTLSLLFQNGGAYGPGSNNNNNDNYGNYFNEDDDGGDKILGQNAFYQSAAHQTNSDNNTGAFGYSSPKLPLHSYYTPTAFAPPAPAAPAAAAHPKSAATAPAPAPAPAPAAAAHPKSAAAITSAMSGMVLSAIPKKDFISIEPLENYLSMEDYATLLSNKQPIYSDHSPIKYNLNPFLTVVTWNVANWGYFYEEKHETFNHKFNLRKTETFDDYKMRLVNIVNAINEIVSKIVTKNKKTGEVLYPFVLCQELPDTFKINTLLSNNNKSDQVTKNLESSELLNSLLQQKNLHIIGNESSEFGLICHSNNAGKFMHSSNMLTSEDEIVSLKSIDKCLPGLINRYDVYSTLMNSTDVCFYVNVHLKFTKNRSDIAKQILYNNTQNYFSNDTKNCKTNLFCR